MRYSGHYAIASRNNHTVHILPAGENIGRMEFYLEVDNVDTVWEPFDREYGMREIHVAIPFTNTLLFIGQELNVKK